MVHEQESFFLDGGASIRRGHSQNREAAITLAEIAPANHTHACTTAGQKSAFIAKKCRLLTDD